MSEEVSIVSRDYWFKVVDFLQQNWTLIDASVNGNGCTVYFFDDTSGVFDQLEFPSSRKAEVALHRNGFGLLSKDAVWRKNLTPPVAPFRKSDHPNGRIYSSGRYWK
jgi:hypothetical protein